MAAFIIYLLTGIVTALLVVYMLAGAWMGGPIVVTEYTSLVGSCALMVAALISLFQRKQGSIFACIGVAGASSFWFIEPIKAMRLARLNSAQLIIFCTVWSMLALCLAFAIKNIRTISPKYPSIIVRGVILSISTALLLVGILGIEWQQKANQRTPSRYEISDGYVGWIEIQYDISGALKTSVRDKQFVFSIPATGLLKTSTAQQFGEAHDHYYYCGTSGCRELPDTDWGKGGMIWAESSGTFEEEGKPEVRKEQFFVGTESQYKKMQTLSNLGDGVDGMAPGDLKAKLQ